MSLSNELSALGTRLTTIQLECVKLLKSEIDNTEDILNKLQLRDMIKIIESDIKCRIDLTTVAGVIPRVSFTDESYELFFDCSKKVAEELSDIQMPDTIAYAYNISVRAIYDRLNCSLQDVFTIISILITSVALCLNQIGSKLSNIIETLDTLLDIKQRQLSLVTQLLKWRGTFIS